MEEEKRLATSSSFILEESIKQQQIKRKFKGISRFVVTAYMFLPFLSEVTGDDVKTCTAFVIGIPIDVYCWLEVFFAAALIAVGYYVQLHRIADGTLKNSRLGYFKLVIGLACFTGTALSNFLLTGLHLGLVLRVPLLVCCSCSIFQIAKMYFSVLYHNFKYFLLMWISIGLFWVSGGALFSDYEFESTTNFFQEFYEGAWSLLVLQSSANFPDVSLPYVAKNMASMVFFVVFLLCNTIIISNVIIANSSNAYKQSTESYELTEGLPKVLLQVLRKKEKKLLELQALRRMSAAGLALREVVNSPFYRLNQWVLNVALFLVVCYHPLGLFPDGILLIMLVLTAMLSFSTLVLALTMPIKLVIRRPFLLYDIGVLAFTCFGFILLFIDSNFSSVCLYFALLRIPHIVKPVLSVLLKDELESLRYYGLKTKDATQVQYTLAPRVVRAFFTMFLVMLFFSGVGISLFYGLLNQQSREILTAASLNPDYVFLNFNSTLNSFMTLFTLLIVNNWNNVVAAYVVVSGTRLTRLYFIVYYMFGVLMAYTIVATCIIECMVLLAERKKKQALGPLARQTHSANIKDRLLKIVRENSTLRSLQEQLPEEQLQSCIDEEIKSIQTAHQMV